MIRNKCKPNVCVPYCCHNTWHSPINKIDTISVGDTITTSSENSATVLDRTGAPHHILDFIIPKGKDGIDGENGKGLEILGTIDSVDDLPNDAHNGDSYLVGLTDPRTLYIYDIKLQIWIDQGTLQGVDGEDGITPTIGENGNWFLGEIDTQKPSRGEKGAPGEQGPSLIKEAYFVTLNDPDNTIPDAGLEVASGNRLPIKRLEVQTAELFVLDSNDNTIQFNQTGTYEIVFTTNAYCQKTGEDFNHTTDFVSIGFRTVDGDIVYAGANDWSYNEVAKNITGVGIFIVTSIAEPFELVNLSNKSVYINGGKIANVITDSYFSCPIVTVIIKKLS